MTGREGGAKGRNPGWKRRKRRRRRWKEEAWNCGGKCWGRWRGNIVLNRKIGILINTRGLSIKGRGKRVREGAEWRNDDSFRSFHPSRVFDTRLNVFSNSPRSGTSRRNRLYRNENLDVWRSAIDDSILPSIHWIPRAPMRITCHASDFRRKFCSRFCQGKSIWKIRIHIVRNIY